MSFLDNLEEILNREDDRKRNSEYKFLVSTEFMRIMTAKQKGDQATLDAIYKRMESEANDRKKKEYAALQHKLSKDDFDIFSKIDEKYKRIAGLCFTSEYYSWQLNLTLHSTDEEYVNSDYYEPTTFVLKYRIGKEYIIGSYFGDYFTERSRHNSSQILDALEKLKIECYPLH